MQLNVLSSFAIFGRDFGYFVRFRYWNCLRFKSTLLLQDDAIHAYLTILNRSSFVNYNRKKREREREKKKEREEKGKCTNRRKGFLVGACVFARVCDFNNLYLGIFGMPCLWSRIYTGHMILCCCGSCSL